MKRLPRVIGEIFMKELGLVMLNEKENMYKKLAEIIGKQDLADRLLL